MSNLPVPKTRKEKITFYITLAREYIVARNQIEKKSMCDICTPYTLKTGTIRTGFVPNRRAIWRYVKKIREGKIS